MPLTADDIAQVATIVAQTMAQLQVAGDHGPKPQNVDERHFRKLATFGGGALEGLGIPVQEQQGICNVTLG